MNLVTMLLTYEVKKLKTKLNFCSELINEIDKEILNLRLEDNKRLKVIRSELRDLRDFLKED